MTFFLTLGSSIGWTALDFSRRQLGRSFGPITVVVLIMATQGLFSLGFGGTGVLSELDGSWWGSAMASIGLNAVANVLFVMSVSRAPYTLAIPLLSLSPAIAAFVGWIAFGETLTPRQLVGVGLIVLASLGLGLRGEKRFPTSKEAVGLAMMIATAVMWATAPFFDKLCTSDTRVGTGAYLAVQCLGIAGVLVPFLALERSGFSATCDQLRRLKPYLWIGLAVAGSTLGLWLQLWAIQTTPVGLFEAGKRSLNLILALVAGRLFLKEQITLEKIIAVVAMALGIAALQ